MARLRLKFGITRRGNMKTAVYLILSVAVASIAYSLAPDVKRYLKIKSM
jgi:hypothetical protein